MKSIIFVFIIFVLPLVTFGQEETPKKERNTIGVSISYYAESAYHPGFKLSTSYYLLEKERNVSKFKRDREKIKTRRHNLFVSSGMGLYNHPNNRKVLFFDVELGHTFVLTRGFKTELGVGLGYMRTFYNAQLFTLNEEGQIEEIKRGGRSKFMPSFTFGFGYDFSSRFKAPLSMEMNFPIFLETPYNHTAILTPVFEFGLTVFIGKKKNNE